MEAITNFLVKIDDILYYPILIVVLLAAGIYFTCKTRCIQLRMFGESIRVVMEKPAKEGSVSSFQALMVSTASRVGTGNIVGVSTAICLGGFGAAFWMWVIALIGGSSAFIESTLAQIYKRRDENGDSYGGPAYYIESALHNRGLAVIFAVSLILTYAFGFNMLASYNLQGTFMVYGFYNKAVTPWIIGAIFAVLTAWCVMGGGKKIVKVTSTLVPIMGLLYVAVSLVVILFHINLVPSVFAQIFKDAFDFQAIFGGFAGSCVMYGIKRGLFSNEAGVGSAPNAAAAADVSHPVKQGLVQMLSVFIDTLLICTATALMALSSGIVPSVELKGALFVQTALAQTFGVAAPYFISAALLLFAFTTLLGNLFYCEGALNYISKRKVSRKTMTVFNLCAVVVIFLGAQLEFGLVWDLADVLMGIMALINLPVIVVLGGTAMRALEDYVAQRKAGKDPQFKAASIGLKEQTDFWN